ncbi:MAG: hypothetical protein HQ488_02820 [Parcubacteria group bacterium]|nr:hypothetical protein [Parcubacteria group bacterium]
MVQTFVIRLSDCNFRSEDMIKESAMDEEMEILPNGWLREDEWEDTNRLRCSQRDPARGEIRSDGFASYAEELSPQELGAMDNLVLRREDDGFWVDWDGESYGPFNNYSPWPHVCRIDGVLVVHAGRRVEGVFQAFLIAQGVMRGPFRNASTPRFKRGYFHTEPRFDGDYVVWGNCVSGPHEGVSCARLTCTNIRVFRIADTSRNSWGHRVLTDLSRRAQFPRHTTL